MNTRAIYSTHDDEERRHNDPSLSHSHVHSDVRETSLLMPNADSYLAQDAAGEEGTGRRDDTKGRRRTTGWQYACFVWFALSALSLSGIDFMSDRQLLFVAANLLISALAAYRAYLRTLRREGHATGDE